MKSPSAHPSTPGGCFGDQGVDCMAQMNSFPDGATQCLDDRWREIFPLPPCPDVDRTPGLSTSARRRRAKVRSKVDQVNSIIRTLNEMYAPSQDGDFSLSSMTATQRACHHELFRSVSRQKAPSSVLSMREATQELLQSDLSAYAGEVATTVRPYDRGLLSIPSVGNQSIDLSTVLDDVGREIIGDPSRCMLLGDGEVGMMTEKNEPIVTYMDPILRDDLPTYCEFIHDLYQAGMIEFTNRPTGLVTPFCVAKKSGRLRLILDCRDTNLRFKPPPPMAAGTGAAWSQIRIPQGQQLFVAQSDIKDYFYSLQLPPELRPMFAMPPVPAELVRHWQVSAEHGGSLDGGDWGCTLC